MADTESRSTAAPDTRGPAPSHHAGVRDHPPGGVVRVEKGELRVPVAARTARWAPEDVAQLALELRTHLSPRTQYTLGEVAQRWLAQVQRVRHADEVRNVQQLRPLWGYRDGELLASACDEWFQHLARAGYSPVSINKYRAAGRLALRYAQGAGLWKGPNPFELSAHLREPRKKRELPSQAQLRAACAYLAPEYRDMLLLSAALGLRTGEVFALRVEDVDLTRGLLHVRRSHGRDETKTGVARELPLLDCLRPMLARRLELLPAGLVFPSRTGGLRRRDAKLAAMLRAAMADAGQLEERLAKLRWQDLRHCAATWHAEAGADARAVRMMLGHLGGDLSETTYLHVDMRWLARELSRLDLNQLAPAVAT